jgi:hypothetical protein
VSTTQVAIVVLILAAFALGRFTRGPRRGAEQRAALTAARQADAGLADTSAAFQAALALWQGQDPIASSSRVLALRSVDAFDQRRQAVTSAFELHPPTSAGLAAASARAERAIGRLADGLARYADGAPLDVERERALVSAERALAAARIELLKAVPREW